MFMSDKINLAGHIAKSKAFLVKKACKKLFETTNVDYFCYLRRYKDGSFTFLPTNSDPGSYFFEDGLYPYSWFAGVPFESLKSGYVFWDIAKQVSGEQSKGLEQVLINDFKLSVGIEVIEKTKNYCEFYSFSGNNPALYFLQIQQLYHFIFYFKQECQHLLLDAFANRLWLYNQNINLNPIPIISHENAVLTDEFNIKRYYLNGKYEGVFLTKREVEILRKIVDGDTVKCLADSLFISPRTLEHHITNIKRKLNATRTTEILQIARLNKIVT
jgi:DNA-binding CsgD family transcriptional regulator